MNITLLKRREKQQQKATVICSVCDWSICSAYFSIKWKTAEKQRIYKEYLCSHIQDIGKSNYNNFCLTRVLWELTHIYKYTLVLEWKTPSKYKVILMFWSSLVNFLTLNSTLCYNPIAFAGITYSSRWNNNKGIKDVVFCCRWGKSLLVLTANHLWLWNVLCSMANAGVIDSWWAITSKG